MPESSGKNHYKGQHLMVEDFNMEPLFPRSKKESIPHTQERAQDKAQEPFQG
jgi:hypothetical protein